MKKLKWAFFLVFTILCFTGGVLADRALVGFGEMQEKTWSSDEDSRPVCRNVLRPNFILPVAGMLFNQAPAEALSRSRAEELFREALETTNYTKRAELLRQAAVVIPVEDLQEAIEWAGQIPEGGDRAFFLADLLGRWAKQDIASALEYAKSLAGAGQRQSALLSVVGVWMQHDVDAALAWVQKQPDGQLRSQSLQTAIWQVSATDPARAAELAGKLNPLQADLQMGTIYRQWAALDPDVAAEKAGRLPPGQGRFMALNSVAAAWAENDVDAALAWIKSLEPGPETEGLVSAAIVSYGTMQKDPKHALELAMQEGSTQTARSVLQGISYQLTPDDFQDTLEWVKSQPDGEFREGALQTLGWELSYRNPEEAIQLADSLSTDESKNMFVLRAASEWGRTDPLKAADYVERMPDGEMRKSAIDGLIANWAYKDPEAAADWLGRNANDVQPYAVGSLVTSWLGSGQEGSRDRVAAWVDSLPTGAMRDHAMFTLGGTMTYENPKAACGWMAQIENDELRESALSGIAVNWLLQDEEAAREWIERAGLSEEFKKQLLQDPEEPGACRCRCPCLNIQG